MRPKCSPNAAQMWPKCGPNVARMWPEDEILQPEMNPWKFSVARARPEPKPQARNPTRTMKKVARPSPTIIGKKILILIFQILLEFDYCQSLTINDENTTQHNCDE